MNRWMNEWLGEQINGSMSCLMDGQTNGYRQIILLGMASHDVIEHHIISCE